MKLQNDMYTENDPPQSSVPTQGTAIPRSTYDADAALAAQWQQQENAYGGQLESPKTSRTTKRRRRGKKATRIKEAKGRTRRKEENVKEEGERTGKMTTTENSLHQAATSRHPPPCMHRQWRLKDLE